LVHAFEATLSLLHPFMPFLTEELWQNLPVKDKVESICISRYPKAEDGITDSDAEENMKVIMDLVTGIRNIRGELNLSPSLELNVMIKTMDGTKAVIDENITYITKLAKAVIEAGDDIESPEGAATAIRPSMEIYVPLKGLFDIGAEISRLSKEMAKVQEAFSFIDKKLSNEGFVKKAPEAVVEENMAKHAELQDKIKVTEESIDKLKELKESDG
jgi:valyl-tRNA synthetase